MIEEVAAIFIGLGLAFSLCSRSCRKDAEFLHSATQVDKLKWLDQLLKSKRVSSNLVVVFGTVGSTSSVETNRSKTSGVFFKETASIDFQRMTSAGATPPLEHECTLLNLRKVPWYLEDDTLRVNVKRYQHAEGFDATLQKYFFTDPVSKHFNSLISGNKKIKVKDPDGCRSCESVLKIGTPLTIVGMAGRDRDGAPMIRRVYKVFKGREELKKLICVTESTSVFFGSLSICFTAMGMILVAVCVFEDD